MCAGDWIVDLGEGRRFLQYTSCCIINDFGTEKLAGIPLRSGNKVLPHNLRETAGVLFEHGVSDLVVIHFPEGAYLSSKDALEIIQPFLQLPDDFTIGKMGAGDSFCAGVLYGSYQGWSDDKTVRQLKRPRPDPCSPRWVARIR